MIYSCSYHNIHVCICNTCIHVCIEARVAMVHTKHKLDTTNWNSATNYCAERGRAWETRLELVSFSCIFIYTCTCTYVAVCHGHG